MKLINIVGLKFGRLKVVRFVRKDKIAAWECLCDCGQTKIVRGSDLRREFIQSCGCLHREKTAAINFTHGKSGTRSYFEWQQMLRRCSYKNHPRYSDYGGRGIKVCSRWKSFENFLYDMGEKPRGLSLDRKNNDGDYSPKNCRWATKKEQARNSRANRMVTIAGVTRCFVEWCEHYGINYGIAHSRVLIGWPDKLALVTPHKRGSRILRSVAEKQLVA